VTRTPGGTQCEKQWRRGVSIGDALAEARRQSGLTTTQVSQRTCIRETIIRGIERDDYSACGGDFYARGHIRSIARAVGTDPEPLIREYDVTQGAPQVITAADVFEPSTPIKIKERRRPNWSLAMVIAIALIVGFAIYHVVSTPKHPAAAGHRSGATTTSRGQQPSHPQSPAPTASPSARPSAHRVVIALTASQNCWVNLATAGGQTIFSGIVYAGTSEHWTEHQTVNMVIGNPGGISLTVNGKNPVPPGSSNQVVTLSFGPGQKTVS
jgi:cytoskeletal protein RodZ